MHLFYFSLTSANVNKNLTFTIGFIGSNRNGKLAACLNSCQVEGVSYGLF